MGNLTVHPPGRYAEAGDKQCIHVEMDYAAASNKDVLMTWGAGPCMNVIVNDPNSKRGALSHVHNSSPDQGEIYAKALGVVKLMWSMVGEPARGEIYLFAGRAFKFATPFVSDDSFVDEDFSEYVSKAYKGRHFIFDYTSTTHVARKKKDESSYTGDLAYVPLAQSVHLLSESELRSLQANMTTKGSRQI